VGSALGSLQNRKVGGKPQGGWRVLRGIGAVRRTNGRGDQELLSVKLDFTEACRGGMSPSRR